ncbi:hypothetical protein [Rhodococcus sp. NPDC058521]|uniref:hypothetical protein n=1 Tax=Rhodococcus sp. NPDC058521 TaxID=3346536 RepID=UPI0036572AA9
MNSRPDLVARLRGAAVGSLSGGVSIAAHGIGGADAPSDRAIVLLLLACAALGASVGAVRLPVDRLPFMFGTLAAGQVVGHTTLTLVSDHAHSAVPSGPMLSAHAVALVVTALLVLAVETAAARVLAALVRIVRTAIEPYPAGADLWSATPVHRSNVSRSLLAAASAGTRGPPSLA